MTGVAGTAGELTQCVAEAKMQQLQLSGDLLKRRIYGVWPHPQSEDVPCCIDNLQVETRDIACQGTFAPGCIDR